MSENKIYNTIFDLMKKIQPSANKKQKKNTYHELLVFVNENELQEDEMDLLFKGDQSKKIIGILELAGKKNSIGKFKDSSCHLVRFLHSLLYLSGQLEKFRGNFVLYDDFIAMMNLGEHFESHMKDKDYSQKVIEIIKVIIDERPHLQLSSYVKKQYIDYINKALEDYNQSNKYDNKAKSYVVDVVKATSETLAFEPKTWDDVLKLKNKKLLTTEFLNFNTNRDDKVTFVDDDKELEQELINNFIDPLTDQQRLLNFKDYTDEETRKLHLQFETFNPVFFLEKFYGTINLDRFEQNLLNLQNNMQQISAEDGKLIDKNIYKYLECKKLLDYILSKFSNESFFIIKDFKENLNGLQNQMVRSLTPVKKSFDLILKSKTSKDIIQKFQKYFVMKEKIEQFLKFSNFEKLADFLKKINVEIKDISQNRLIYGEFYDFFSRTIENFKSVLINIIQDSSVNNLIIKHFQYLLEFDVEPELIDQILTKLKEKMCDKIKDYLEFTENFEIKNFKDFFCDEYYVEILPDDFFNNIIRNADNHIHQVLQEKYNEDMDLSKTNIIDPNKKEMINVNNILISLYDEIKEYLFMMKVIEENINLKITHLVSKRNTRFITIVTELYFLLFDKLKEFLFVSNFDMQEVIQDNYDKQFEKMQKNGTWFSQKHTDALDRFVKYYSGEKADVAGTAFNENFNKNTLQNLSNLLIDIFGLFEVYLNKDILEGLNDSKNTTIGKIFMGFLNEKIIINLKFFNEENTINFMDTCLTMFNYSGFNFTKNFLKHLYKSYKNIIEFYINIKMKTRDLELDQDIIYSSLFYILKCFYVKFYNFYNTEARDISNDHKRLNCLILEILKNYNFLKVEVKTIMKGLFKNKENEYQMYIDDLELFTDELKTVFIREYIKNEGSNLLRLFTSWSRDNRFPCFYEKYNDQLVSKESLTIFNDIRSVVIDMVFLLAEDIKELTNIEGGGSEFRYSLMRTKTDITSPKPVVRDANNDKIINIISDIVEEFYNQLYDYILGSNELKEDSKILAQVYLEYDLFNKYLTNFSQKENTKIRQKDIYNALLEYLYKGKGSRQSVSYLDESAIFSNEEVERKTKLLEDYGNKYFAFLKCLKIQ
jgi:uncharacterized protein (DUF2164 family)